MQDELKNIWESASQSVEITNEKVDNIINKKSLNLIERLIKTVKREHIFNMFASPMLIAFFIIIAEYKVALILSALLIPILVYYHFLIKKFDNHRIGINVYEYLKQSYKTLNGFIRHYYFGAFIIMIISIYIGYQLDDSIVSQYTGLIDVKRFSFEIFYLISITLISILPVYLYIYLLYVRKLKRLRKIIQELEN